MLNPKNILVALDFSPHAQQTSKLAAEEAFKLAQVFDAKVHLLHVFTLQDKRESEINFGHGSELNDARSNERKELDDVAGAHKASGHLGEVFWTEGDPGQQILLTAEKQGVNLIVVGGSGRSALSRLVLGSVAEAVVRHASCNVLVVRESATDRDAD